MRRDGFVIVAICLPKAELNSSRILPTAVVRLLAVRVPESVAATRRSKMQQEAKDRGKTISETRLALAGWTILVTNVPAALLSLEEALVLARARWQIELLFKLWKQDGCVDDWRGKKPWPILCEV